MWLFLTRSNYEYSSQTREIATTNSTTSLYSTVVFFPLASSYIPSLFDCILVYILTLTKTITTITLILYYFLSTVAYFIRASLYCLWTNCICALLVPTCTI
uniref:Ovule protein n=1 Tax=Heterorhabditis bacteriophora TaxID=37862 RepID=A0A1I7WRQ4_HETBA